MATGRHDVDHIGVDPVNLPFKIDNVTITFSGTEEQGTAARNLAVKLSANRTVALVGDGDAVLGKLLKVEPDGFATVQVGGGCDLPAGASATVSAGSKIVGALGASSAKGYIRNAGAAGAAYAEAAADDASAARHTVFDASDTTKVQVLLGA